MKFTKEQKNNIEAVLAWRDFALALNRKEKDRIQKKALKMLEKVLE